MDSLQYVHAPVVTSVPVLGRAERFPINRVYCVGRNYADHALEMGVDPRTDPPFFFCKPADTVYAPQEPDETLSLAYPPGTVNLHHEVELVLAIGRGGRDIAVDSALDHVFGYAVGIDMTRRDLQLAMRQAGKPWEIGKSFERCAPISALHPVGLTGVIDSGVIELSVDGELRQRSDLSKLIWSIPEIIADLSRLFTLQPGDLIFTGTPEGVGPVLPGHTMTARIEGLGALQVRITDSEGVRV